jgi:uncharacterized protein (TIGR02147 family)
VQTKADRGSGRIPSELKEHLKEPPVKRMMPLEEFKKIHLWYRYAILELTQIEGFVSDPAWIADRVGISREECEESIAVLLKLGLLETRGGRLAKCDQWVDTADKSMTSSVHRDFQRQILEQSMRSLASDPIEIRNHVSITSPINPTRIPQAKEKIEAFLWELTAFLSRGAKSQVYTLTLNLFPVSKK